MESDCGCKKRSQQDALDAQDTLFPPQCSFPPSCTLIEGWSDVKTVAYTIIPPSGYKFALEQDYIDAFVTFFHQSSKYSEPRNDGFFVRDLVGTTYPPSTA